MPNRIHRGWYVVATTFLVLLVSAAIRATPGVLIVPLEHELGWSRATLSLAVSVNLLLYGVVGPFGAAVAEKVGVRRTMALAMGTLAAALLLTTRIRAPWQLVILWGVVVGAGTGSAAMVLGGVVVSRWFARRRGLVLGALTASTATGQLLFLPLLARVASSGAGWRGALVVVASAALLMVPLALLIVRETPASVGLRPFGATDGDAAPPARAGSAAALALRTLRRAAGSPQFWPLAGTFFACGATANGLVGTHLIPACVDAGIGEVRAAGMLATMGAFDVLGTTISGWLTDRYDPRRLLFAYYAIRGTSLLFLPHALGVAGPGLHVFTLLYGLDWVATVPPTARLAADAFGDEDGPIVFGWLFAAHQVGAALAALGAGVARTRLGNYHATFLMAGALCAAAAATALLIRRERHVPRSGTELSAVRSTLSLEWAQTGDSPEAPRTGR